MHRRVVSVLTLLAILLLCFAVRAMSFFLPAVPASGQELFRDEAGEPYLTEMDSYYYLRLAETMAETNRIVLYNHRQSDPLIETGDDGVPHAYGDPLLLPAIAFCIWKAVSLLFPVSMIQAARWIGPLLAPLAAIPAYFYVRRRTNRTGAVTAGILAGLAIPFTGHTFAGFFDTDCLLALMPLCLVLAHLRAMQETRTGQQVVFSALAGLSFAVLSLSWTAYYAYFWVTAIGGAASCILIAVFLPAVPLSRKGVAIRGFGMTLGFMLLFLLVLRGGSGIRDLAGALASWRSVINPSAFPFTHQFTQEMQAITVFPDLRQESLFSLFTGGTGTLLNRTGGLLPWIAALLWLLLGLKSSRTGKHIPEAPVISGDPVLLMTETGTLLPWLAAGIRLAAEYRRIAEVAVLPLTILAGLGIGFLAELAARRIPGPHRAAPVILAAGICLATMTGAVGVSRGNIPAVTDPEAQAMAQIRETEPDHTVIASWWDDGYFMQYAARRRTLADGGSSSGTMYYFLANALLTDDPAEMAGIFRMLDTSGTQAVEFLVSQGFSEAETTALLIRITALSRDKAEELLTDETVLRPEDRTALLALTHSRKQDPLLLILGSDLLEKLDSIAYYGLWNMEMKSQNTSLYRMISKKSLPMIPGTTCSFELTGTEEKLEIRIGEDGDVNLIPDPDTMFYNAGSLSLWESGECILTRDLGGSGPSVILIANEGRLSAFVCNPELSRSMLVRLFVCGDRSVPGTEETGVWYGKKREEDSPLQSLLNGSDRLAWGFRTWRLTSVE